MVFLYEKLIFSSLDIYLGDLFLGSFFLVNNICQGIFHGCGQKCILLIFDSYPFHGNHCTGGIYNIVSILVVHRYDYFQISKSIVHIFITYHLNFMKLYVWGSSVWDLKPVIASNYQMIKMWYLCYFIEGPDKTIGLPLIRNIQKNVVLNIKSDKERWNLCCTLFDPDLLQPVYSKRINFFSFITLFTLNYTDIIYIWIYF